MAASASSAPQPNIAFDCSGGCLERKDYAVKAIVHGTKGDPFWEQLRAAAQQAAADMGVGFDMDLRDSFDPTGMASDIREYAANTPAGRSGLMVTIPNAEVSGAVKEAANSGFPVVGINSGAMFGKDAGTTDFVAPDDVKGGKLAGETLLSLARGRGENENATINALYIDGDYGNQASVDRLTVQDFLYM